MPLVAFITDTHFGVRNDNALFYEYFDLFLDNVFFPTLKKNKIKKIIHLGDVFDRRKYINYQTLTWVRESFLEKTKEYEVDIIAGNHDTYFKSTNKVNSPELLFASYPNIKVYSGPTEVDGILYVPWINPENQQETLNLINKTDCEVVTGHLELTGYTMFKGTVCHGGMSPDVFYKFKSVYTGHFHTKNTSANVTYLGCPWDLIFTDADDVKGFHLYDTDTDELTFVENPYKMYWKKYYDDSTAESIDDLLLSKKEYSKIKNTYIKVYVKGKNNPVFFDRYIAKINECEPASLTIVEDYVSQDGPEEETISLTEDTLSILRDSIADYKDMIQSEDKQAKVQNLLSDLYVEALKV
jgi:DNA repair exonuclease SbcCD nuclease subunit